MASSSSPSFTAVTGCPTVEGKWTIQNFPVLVRTAMATTAGQSSLVASCTLPMECQCVGGCAKVKVSMKFEGARLFRREHLTLHMQLLENQDRSEWKNRVNRWMGNFQFFVDLGGRTVLASANPKRMFNCLEISNLYNGQDMFNVCDMWRYLDAQEQLSLRIKVIHNCPCAAVENSKPIPVRAPIQLAALPLPKATKKEGKKAEIKSGSQTVVKYGSFPDFEIKVTLGGKKSFQVHRNVLIGRSPFFWGLFGDMKDNPQLAKTTTEMEVPDISAQTMGYFLDYLHFGSFSGDELLWVNALPDIAEAADKYSVKDLLEFCDNNLHRAVNERNAVAVMKRANRLGLKIAEATIGEFIRKHPTAVKRNTYTYESSDEDEDELWLPDEAEEDDDEEEDLFD